MSINQVVLILRTKNYVTNLSKPVKIFRKVSKASYAEDVSLYAAVLALMPSVSNHMCAGS